MGTAIIHFEHHWDVLWRSREMRTAFGSGLLGKIVLDAALHAVSEACSDPFRDRLPRYVLIPNRPIGIHITPVGFDAALGFIASISLSILSNHSFVFSHHGSVSKKETDIERLEIKILTDAINDHGYTGVARLNFDGWKALIKQHGEETMRHAMTAYENEIKGLLIEEDKLVHLHDDEYMILMSNKKIGRGPVLSKKIVQALRKPVSIGEKRISATASIGFSCAHPEKINSFLADRPFGGFFNSPHDYAPLTPDVQPDVQNNKGDAGENRSAGTQNREQNKEEYARSILKFTRIALHNAKINGGDRVVHFDESYHSTITHDRRMMRDLRLALSAPSPETGRFLLYLQPKILLSTMRPCGFEALIRFEHPTLGLLAPSRFLSTINRHEDIRLVGDWVFSEALGHQWLLSRHGIHLPISINLMPEQIDADLINEMIEAGTSQYPDARTGLIEFELLESSAIRDMGLVAEIVNSVKSRGIKFALDDFGTGYSSLSYLRNLPVQEVKIDRSFIRDMLEDPSDAQFVRSIIALAQSMKCTTTAEGVERVDQIELLRSMGCERVQGYCLARPMPIEQALTWTEEAMRFGIQCVDVED